MKPAVLLMTATVAPSSAMAGLTRADPAVRTEDYRRALDYYLSVPDTAIDRILFLENSGADLSVLKDSQRRSGSAKRVEFIQTATDSDPAMGKGFGEFRMIEEGLARSGLIAPDDAIWKVTGRLRVRNIARLNDTRPDPLDLYCDLRDVPVIGEALGGNKWMDCRVFAFSAAGYARLFAGQHACDWVIEKGLFKIVAASLEQRDLAILPRFRVQPVLDGFSGFSNASYRSTGYVAKEMLRATARRVVPRLWL